MNHGLLLIDKDPGMTSHDVVSRVRRELNTSSVGHCGTLDPLASGLMVLLIGEATKISNFVLERDKTYLVTLRLGFESDSFDSDGTITKESPVNVTAEQVVREAQALLGDFDWKVPLFSAAKVGGKKLCDVARSGGQVELPIKRMSFSGLEFFPESHAGKGPHDSANKQANQLVDQKNEYQFKISCSKGSYVRSWVNELGQRLGVGAIMIGLRRLRSEPYAIETAVSLEQLGQMRAQARANLEQLDSFVPLHLAMPEVKLVHVSGFDQALLLNGQLSIGLRSRIITLLDPKTDRHIKIVSKADRRLLAIVGFDPGRGIHIRRVFHYKESGQ